MYPWIKDIRIARTIVGKKKDEFNYVNDLAWTPHGKQLASGSNTKEARFWDVPTRAALCKFEGATDKISSVAISPDGKMIAAGSDDFSAVVWDQNVRSAVCSQSPYGLSKLGDVLPKRHGARVGRRGPDGSALGRGNVKSSQTI